MLLAVNLELDCRGDAIEVNGALAGKAISIVAVWSEMSEEYFALMVSSPVLGSYTMLSKVKEGPAD